MVSEVSLVTTYCITVITGKHFDIAIRRSFLANVFLCFTFVRVNKIVITITRIHIISEPSHIDSGLKRLCDGGERQGIRLCSLHAAQPDRPIKVQEENKIFQSNVTNTSACDEITWLSEAGEACSDDIS